MKNLKKDIKEFQFRLYFEMYKDYPSSNRDEFRKMFIKRHGRYEYLNLLLLKIQSYQVDKFNQTIKF